MIDRKGLIFVEDHDIRRSPLPDPFRRQMVEPCRIQVHFFEKLQHGKPPGPYEVHHGKPQGSLQSGDPARGFREGTGFLFGRMRSMVRGNEIDRPVCETLDDLLTVFCRSERRIHSGTGAVFQDCVLREREMMRRRFRVNMCSHSLESPDDLYGIAGAYVLNDKLRTRMERHRAVAGYEHFLRERGSSAEAHGFGDPSPVDTLGGEKCRILLVQTERQTEGTCALHRLIEKGFVHDRKTIVRKSCRPGPGQCFQIDEFSALHFLRYIDCLKDMDSRLPAFFKVPLKDFDAVNGRAGVRHADDRRKAALFRGGRTGLYTLFFSKSRIAEVHMRVDQSGSYTAAGGIDDGAATALRPAFSGSSDFFAGSNLSVRSDFFAGSDLSVRSDHSVGFDLSGDA